jgi:hypothetical protein
MVILQKCPNTGLGIEIINPLAQIANTYNDYNLKKINGNFGLVTRFSKILRFQVLLVLILQTASLNLCQTNFVLDKSFR